MRSRLKRIQPSKPLRSIDVLEIFNRRGEVGDHVVCAVFDLLRIGDGGDVAVFGGGAAEEDDAEEEEGGQRGDDLEASVEVCAWIASRHDPRGLWSGIACAV